MGSARRKIRQHLGSFLKMQPESNVEIYFKTGIHPTRISKLSKPDKDTMTAVEFCMIAMAVNADLDKMAAHIYQEYSLFPDEPSPANRGLTRFGKYLNENLVLQKTVAIRAGISNSKLSVLANDENSVPLAKEVYLTALALSQKPSDAFKSICGDLTLVSLDEQVALKLKYKGKG